MKDVSLNSRQLAVILFAIEQTKASILGREILTKRLLELNSSSSKSLLEAIHQQTDELLKLTQPIGYIVSFQSANDLTAIASRIKANQPQADIFLFPPQSVDDDTDWVLTCFDRSPVDIQFVADLPFSVQLCSQHAEYIEEHHQSYRKTYEKYLVS